MNLIIVVLIVFCCGMTRAVQLRFAASLPLSSEEDGEAARAVADILRESVPDVNQRVARPAGHNVTLTILDSADSDARAVQNAFTITSPAINCIGLIGEWSSGTTTALALTAANLGIYTCTAAATSADLSNKKEFDALYRMIPDDQQQGRALAQFVKSNWRACAVLSSSSAYGRSIADSFNRMARQLDFFVATNQVMQFHGLDEATNNTAAADKIPLQLVADSGARIILFFGDLSELLYVLPLANEVGLIGPEYVWIASEAVAGLAEEARLDPALQRLVNGFMHIFPVEYANERDAKPLLKRVQLTSPDFERLQPYGGFHRDCLFSLTVNFIEQLRSGVAESLVLSRSSKVPISSFVKPFDGISGPVNFDANGNRIGTFTMFSLFEGNEVAVYEVDPSGRVKQLAEPRFFSGTTIRPSDLPNSLVGFLRFSSAGAILVVLANAAGILCIVGSLVYIVFRRSAPIIVQEANMAVLLLVGLGLSMVLGFSVAWIDVRTTATCHISLWGIGLGFSIALIPLLYRSFWTWVTSENFILRRRDKSHPPRFLFRVAPFAALFVLQLLLLSLWSVFAPLHAQPLATRNSFSFQCRSVDSTAHAIFQSLFFSFDMLLVVVMVYLAFSSRDLALPGNLPRYTSIASTNLLVSCLVLAPFNIFAFPDFSIGSHYVQAAVVLYTCLFTWGMVAGRVIQELRKHSSYASAHLDSPPAAPMCLLDRLCDPVKSKVDKDIDPSVAANSLTAIQPDLLPVAGKPRSFIGDFPVKPARFLATWRIHRLIVAQDEGYIGIISMRSAQGCVWAIKQVFPVKSDMLDMALELYVARKLVVMVQLRTQKQCEMLFEMLAKRAW